MLTELLKTELEFKTNILILLEATLKLLNILLDLTALFTDNPLNLEKKLNLDKLKDNMLKNTLLNPNTVKKLDSKLKKKLNSLVNTKLTPRRLKLDKLSLRNIFFLLSKFINPFYSTDLKESQFANSKTGSCESCSIF